MRYKIRPWFGYKLCDQLELVFLIKQFANHNYVFGSQLILAIPAYQECVISVDLHLLS